MRLWPTILSFIFPLCATTGIAGIAAPGVVDFANFQPARHPAALAAPADFMPTPDVAAPVFDVPPGTLFTAIQSVAAAQPRTYVLDLEPAEQQAAWVVRSAASNFPDIVEAAIIAKGADKSSLILYSHALYGWYDFGVNKSRVSAWLKNLQMKVAG